MLATHNSYIQLGDHILVIFHPFTPFPILLPLPDPLLHLQKVSLLSSIVSSLFYVIYILDFLCKRKHELFTFPCLTYFI